MNALDIITPNLKRPSKRIQNKWLRQMAFRQTLRVIGNVSWLRPAPPVSDLRQSRLWPIAECWDRFHSLWRQYRGSVCIGSGWSTKLLASEFYTSFWKFRTCGLHDGSWDRQNGSKFRYLSSPQNVMWFRIKIRCTSSNCSIGISFTFRHNRAFMSFARFHI